MLRADELPIRLLLSCLAAGLFLGACSDGGTTGPEPEGADPDPNEAPSVEVVSPDDGSVFTEGEAVSFEAEAEDPEDGSLSGSSIVWESSRDGEIGTGASFTRSDLSTGEHAVTVTARDSDGAEGSDDVSVTVELPAASPTLEQLSVKLPRPDLAFSDSAEIAHGEAVTVAWSLGDDPDMDDAPEACTASGGWSGEQSTSSDTVRTAALTGPADLELVLRCENSAGADADTVFVDVGAPGARHATTNRPDISDKQKVRFIYVIPEGGEDRELDLNGGIEDLFEEFQMRFEDKTGRRFRVDTYDDAYDVTFVTVEDNGEVSNEEIRAELKNRGLYNRNKYFLVIFYDGETDGVPSGGWGREAYIFGLREDITDSDLVGHELVHAHNVVDSDAPNEGPEDNPHHVTDHEGDLVSETPGKAFSEDFIVDFGCDDYYWDPALPRCANVPEPAEDITLLSDSPVLFTP